MQRGVFWNPVASTVVVERLQQQQQPPPPPQPPSPGTPTKPPHLRTSSPQSPGRSPNGGSVIVPVLPLASAQPPPAVVQAGSRTRRARRDKESHVPDAQFMMMSPILADVMVDSTPNLPRIAASLPGRLQSPTQVRTPVNSPLSPSHASQGLQYAFAPSQLQVALAASSLPPFQRRGVGTAPLRTSAAASGHTTPQPAGLIKNPLQGIDTSASVRFRTPSSSGGAPGGPLSPAGRRQSSSSASPVIPPFPGTVPEPAATPRSRAQSPAASKGVLSPSRSASSTPRVVIDRTPVRPGRAYTPRSDSSSRRPHTPTAQSVSSNLAARHSQSGTPGSRSPSSHTSPSRLPRGFTHGSPPSESGDHRSVASAAVSMRSLPVDVNTTDLLFSAVPNTRRSPQ